jgi:hypothetical protein
VSRPDHAYGDPDASVALAARSSRSSAASGTSISSVLHEEGIEAMIKHSIVINRPAEEVFAYLDQVDRHHEWQGVGCVNPIPAANSHLANRD